MKHFPNDIADDDDDRAGARANGPGDASNDALDADPGADLDDDLDADPDEDDLDWLDDLEGIDDWDPMQAMQIDLPIGADTFAFGIPTVFVDYFDLTGDVDTAVAALLAIPGAVRDTGATHPRVLIYGQSDPSGTHRPEHLVSIATVFDRTLRLQTGRLDATATMRLVVGERIGEGARHRESRWENPFEWDDE